jgi:hypothetical protein
MERKTGGHLPGTFVMLQNRSTWFLDMTSVPTASSLLIAWHFQAVFHVTGETIRDIHFKCLPYFCTHLKMLFVTAVFWGHSRRLLVARHASLMKKCKMWLHKQAEIFVDGEESRCYWSVVDMPWNNGDCAEKWHSCTEPVCLILSSKKLLNVLIWLTFINNQYCICCKLIFWSIVFFLFCFVSFFFFV